MHCVPDALLTRYRVILCSAVMGQWWASRTHEVLVFKDENSMRARIEHIRMTDVHVTNIREVGEYRTTFVAKKHSSAFLNRALFVNSNRVSSCANKQAVWNSWQLVVHWRELSGRTGIKDCHWDQVWSHKWTSFSALLTLVTVRQNCRTNKIFLRVAVSHQRVVWRQCKVQRGKWFRLAALNNNFVQ